MQIRFWGTRGSIAKAGPDTVRYGGNTSCVELRSASGTLVVLDCGTGAHGLGYRLLDDARGPVDGHILIGHTHWDHIQGFPLFIPLRKQGNEWSIYGPRGAGVSLRDTMAGQMEYTYFPVALEQLDATVHYQELVEGVFEIGDIRVTTQYLNHPALTLGYRLEADGVSVVYATDHEPHSRQLAMGGRGPITGEDEKHARFLAEADLVIHDAQFTASEYPDKTGWGHSTVEYVVDVASFAGVRRLALFHHDPLRDDAGVDGLVTLARERVAAEGGRVEVFGAAEGGAYTVQPSARAPSKRPAGPGSALASPAGALGDQSVLIAVHDAACSSLLCEAARADGLGVFDPEGAPAILATVRNEQPSLMMLEDAQPGLDALAVCRQVRSLEGAYAKNVAIVLLKDAEEPERREEEADVGVTDWLLKPFDNMYARTRIRAWLLRTACRWVRAPRPPDEEKRIRALRELEILDTEPEERFDRYTRIAAALFDTPIALVSLVDSDRQWFKSRFGLEATEIPRDMSFCAHAVVGAEVLQVPDALGDSRFADNPLVSEEPRVRFYAGAPLTLSDGSRAGTLCVVDHHPRYLDKTQLGLLRDLAVLVVDELETHSRASQ